MAAILSYNRRVFIVKNPAVPFWLNEYKEGVEKRKKYISKEEESERKGWRRRRRSKSNAERWRQVVGREKVSGARNLAKAKEFLTLAVSRTWILQRGGPGPKKWSIVIDALRSILSSPLPHSIHRRLAPGIHRSCSILQRVHQNNKNNKTAKLKIRH